MAAESATIDWHWLFGLTLTDLFQDTPWRVELEKNLALQKQQLDVAIIEQQAPSGSVGELPDGLDNLRRHNLLTYKSGPWMNCWVISSIIASCWKTIRGTCRRSATFSCMR